MLLRPMARLKRRMKEGLLQLGLTSCLPYAWEAREAAREAGSWHACTCRPACCLATAALREIIVCGGSGGGRGARSAGRWQVRWPTSSDRGEAGSASDRERHGFGKRL